MLDKIRIKGITDECGLNRQTFYYHFDDTYQLVDWLLKKKLFQSIRNSLEKSEEGRALAEKQKEQLSKYYVISCGSYIVAWMMGIVEESPEEITDFVVRQIEKKKTS